MSKPVSIKPARKSEIEVRTEQYEFAHSHKPSAARGCSDYTPWWFADKATGEQFSVTGKWSDARKKAVEYAASRHFYTIIVCS